MTWQGLGYFLQKWLSIAMYKYPAMIHITCQGFYAFIGVIGLYSVLKGVDGDMQDDGKARLSFAFDVGMIE